MPKMQAQRPPQLLAARLGQLGCEGAEQGDGELVEFHVAIAHDLMKSQHPNFSTARTAGQIRRRKEMLCK